VGSYTLNLIIENVENEIAERIEFVRKNSEIKISLLET
jgi:hypothetical protein